MPYIKSKLVIEEITPLAIEKDGKSIGQLVDEAVGEMISEMPPGAVPLSIEFGFEDANDFQRFAHLKGDVLADASMAHSRKKRRSLPA